MGNKFAKIFLTIFIFMNVISSSMTAFANNYRESTNNPLLGFHLGGMGDCVFCAALNALNRTIKGRQTISKMVRQDGYGGYIIKLGDGQRVYVSASEMQSWHGIVGNDYAKVIEIAAAKANGGSINGIGSQQSYHILNGTNDTRIDGAIKIKGVLEALAIDVDNGQVAMLAGIKVNGSGIPQALNSNGGMHAFTITNIDKQNGRITIHNPWAGDSSRDITMYINEFANKASSIDYTTPY